MGCRGEEAQFPQPGHTDIGETTLKYLGHSFDSKAASRIEEAAAPLIKVKPHIKVFAEDNGQDLPLSGEVDLTMEWDGDILQVMADDGGAHDGREWDLGAFKTLPTEAGEFRFGVQGAASDADRFAADATKIWASVEFRLAPSTLGDVTAILSND